MKTKLLKKLRKQAHDTYRIAPTWRDNEWVIKYTVTENGRLLYWKKTNEYFTDLNKAIKRLEEKREFEFKCLANTLIRDRIYKKRLKQVKDL